MSTLRTNEVEMLDGRGKGAITFDNVEEMKDSTSIKVGQKVRTLGYYEPGDGGGNDYEVVGAATGTADGGSYIDLPGSGFQARGLFDSEVDIRQFGATGDDDKTIEFLSAVSFVFSGNKGLFIRSPVYISDTHVSSGQGSITCEGAGIIYASDDAEEGDFSGDYLLDFGNGVTDSTFIIRMDLRGKDKSGVVFRGARIYAPYIRVEDIGQIPGRSNTQNAVSCGGDDSKFGDVYVSNVTSRDHNAITVTGDVKNVEISNISSVGACSAYQGDGHNVTIDYLFSDGCEANSIYCIEGSVNFTCHKAVIYNNTDEGIIFSGDDKGVKVGNISPYIGEALFYNCGRCLGFNDVSDLRIGTIRAINSSTALYERPLNVSTDSVSVQSIDIIDDNYDGGARIFSFDKGSVGYLSVGSISAVLTYNGDIGLNGYKTLNLSSSIKGMNIGQTFISIHDGTGGSVTSSDIFVFRLLDSPDFNSSFGPVLVEKNNSPYRINIESAISEKMQILGGRYKISGDADLSLQVYPTKMLMGSNEPTSSNIQWNQGDIIWFSAPSAGGTLGWVCTESGAPGTWKSFGSIEA